MSVNAQNRRAAAEAGMLVPRQDTDTTATTTTTSNDPSPSEYHP
jgi:hypothetical protein